ncbi:unnamed protein product [Mytilus coruscus]|uniref:WSC domain-containing protein n=1 Tax=Mytilus coruscus TaxID=42192 RepID=A0A6J8B984_MYTCO|nr:unnamed protein product [Mytilus coruscus]
MNLWFSMKVSVLKVTTVCSQKLLNARDLSPCTRNDVTTVCSQKLLNARDLSPCTRNDVTTVCSQKLLNARDLSTCDVIDLEREPAKEPVYTAVHKNKKDNRKTGNSDTLVPEPAYDEVYQPLNSNKNVDENHNFRHAKRFQNGNVDGSYVGLLCTGTLYFIPDSRNWNDASDYCTNVLTGTLLPYGSEFLDFTTSCSIQNTRIWLGKPWPEYLGCKEDKLALSIKSKIDNNQMVECLDFCRVYSLFGVQGKACKCFSSTTTFNSNTECSEVCPGNNAETCGGFRSMDTYRVVNSMSGGNCQSLHHNSSVYYTLQPDDCDSSLSFICKETEKTTESVTNDTSNDRCDVGNLATTPQNNKRITETEKKQNQSQSVRRKNTIIEITSEITNHIVD